MQGYVCLIEGQETTVKTHTAWPSVARELLMFHSNPQCLKRTWPTCTLRLLLVSLPPDIL